MQYGQSHLRHFSTWEAHALWNHLVDFLAVGSNTESGDSLEMGKSSIGVPRAPVSSISDGGVTFVATHGLDAGERVAIFDSNHPINGPHDEACINGAPSDPGPGVSYVTINLMSCSGGLYSLENSYDSSVTAAGLPDFSQGSSGGLGGMGGGYFGVDPVSIETLFDDAFVEFVAPKSGSGPVPYLHRAFFGDPRRTSVLQQLSYFSDRWFDHKQDGQFVAAGYPLSDVAHNYFHVLGLSESTTNNGLCD
jgi:hypothetical protein